MNSDSVDTPRFDELLQMLRYNNVHSEGLLWHVYEHCFEDQGMPCY
jgi:hypothetical protein